MQKVQYNVGPTHNSMSW